MSLSDLTLTDCQRLKRIVGLVRLSSKESAAFRNAAMGIASSVLGIGDPVEPSALLVPLERTREKLVELFGAAYVDDLIARIRR